MQELPEQQQQQEEEEEEEELQQEEEQQGVNSIELLPSGVLFGRIFWPFFFELAKQDFGVYVESHAISKIHLPLRSFL